MPYIVEKKVNPNAEDEAYELHRQNIVDGGADLDLIVCEDREDRRSETRLRRLRRARVNAMLRAGAVTGVK